VIGACAKATAMLMSSSNGSNNNNGSNKNTNLPLPQQKALQLLNVMKKDASVVDPNVQVYNAAIRACAEAMDLTRALQLLDDMRQQKLEPTLVTCTYTKAYFFLI